MSRTGKQWSWYPPNSPTGGMRIVEGYRAIGDRILTVLLTRPGEDPLHPDLGYAPDLFANLSLASSQYYVVTVEDALRQWNTSGRIGLDTLTVTVEPQTEYTNQIEISVWYSASGQSLRHQLTFGVSDYVGADYTRSLRQFIESVALDGLSFRGF